MTRSVTVGDAGGDVSPLFAFTKQSLSSEAIVVIQRFLLVWLVTATGHGGHTAVILVHTGHTLDTGCTRAGGSLWHNQHWALLLSGWLMMNAVSLSVE